MMKMSIMTKANKAAKRLGIDPAQITHIHDLSEVSSEGAKGIMIVYQVADEKYAAIVCDNGHIKSGSLVRDTIRLLICLIRQRRL